MINVPQPCKGNVWSGPPSIIGDTWLESETGRQRRARVRFPDGKLRVVRCGTADTYFSIRCSSHNGYVTSQETTWAPDGEYVFRPHTSADDKYGSWDNGK